MVRVNDVYRICYQNNIKTSNCQCHIHFPFLPDSLLTEYLKLFCGIQFFSESEFRFSRNYYDIIPFQMEWPDRTSQVSMKTIPFAVFCPV